MSQAVNDRRESEILYNIIKKLSLFSVSSLTVSYGLGEKKSELHIILPFFRSLNAFFVRFQWKLFVIFFMAATRLLTVCPIEQCRVS